MTDLLNEKVLSGSLSAFADLRAFYFDCCDSTNAEAKRLAEGGFSGRALLAAGEQTAGRGRLGRSFWSPSGSGVYFSILDTVSRPLEIAVSVPCAASVAVMRAIRKVCGKQTAIKWVNDLLYREKKICGILAEAVRQGEKTALIVGIGINLRRADFPPELREIAGTLDDDHTPRVDLIAGVARELLPFLRDPSSREWLDDYRACSCVIGKRIAFTRAGETTFATAVGIDRDGGLLVRTGAGEEILRSGEITVRFG